MEEKGQTDLIYKHFWQEKKGITKSVLECQNAKLVKCLGKEKWFKLPMCI